MIEEAYEVADAIERDALTELPGELGDLLFQVLFYTELAAEAKLFTLDDVVTGLEHKLEERHPHVFGAEEVSDVGTVNLRWEERKAEARRARNPEQVVSELDDVPLGLPALTRAQKLQRRAARVGFDWPDVDGAWDKLQEELAELAAAIAMGDRNAIADEFGDLLFSLGNVARHLEIDAESVLRRANRKFERRFRAVESAARGRGDALATSSPAQLDAWWDAVKLAE